MSGRRLDEATWQAIRLDYEAEGLSARALGRKYGVSHTAIQNRSKAQGWARSVKSKVRARAAQKIAIVIASPWVETSLVAMDSEVATGKGYGCLETSSDPLQFIKGLRQRLAEALQDVETIERQLERVAAHPAVSS